MRELPATKEHLGEALRVLHEPCLCGGERGATNQGVYGLIVCTVCGSEALRLRFVSSGQAALAAAVEPIAQAAQAGDEEALEWLRRRASP